MTNKKQDWLAWIEIGAGSTWGRSDTKSHAIIYAVHGLKDWDKLYDVWDKEVTVHVIEVTGYGDVIWDYEGVHGVPVVATEDKYVKIERPVERVKERTKPKPPAVKQKRATGYSGTGLRDFKA